MNLTTHYNRIDTKAFKTNCSVCGIEIERVAIAKSYTCFDCKRKRQNERDRSEYGKKAWEKEKSTRQTASEWISEHRYDGT